MRLGPTRGIAAALAATLALSWPGCEAMALPSFALVVAAVAQANPAIRRTTRAGEPIFTYPALPLFHGLADRPLSTFATLHWIEVTPDAIARADILRLRASPPAVVLRQHIPTRILRSNEWYFRGAPGASGLREMDVALVELLTEKYRLAAEFPQYLGSAPHLEVWVRNDR